MNRFMQTLLFACLFLSIGQAQNVVVYPTPDRISGEVVEARKSPLATAHLQAGDTYLKIVYGQPHLRGREMLGNQVSYGKVWRLGANEATEIFVSKAFKMGGEKIEAGIYSLYAIPTKDKWTVIVNKKLGQWGSYQYDEKLDVARFEVPVKGAKKDYEAFSIWFAPDGSAINMAWGRTIVSVPVEVE